MRVSFLLVTILLAAAAGCDAKKSSAPQAAGKPSAKSPAAAKPAKPAKPARVGLGTIERGGHTFRPTHSVALWQEKKHELQVFLYAFEPSEAEIQQIRRGRTWIGMNKPSPDTKQWPDHCPSASYSLNWSRNPDTVGDASKARFAVHVHGVKKRGSNYSLNNPSSTAVLEGKLRAGETLRFKDQGRGSDPDQPAWDLEFETKVYVPAPPPKAPELKPEQKGALGVLALGERVFPVEGVLAKRDKSLLYVALLSRAVREGDAEAYRAGKLALVLKEGGEDSPYVEIYFYAKPGEPTDKCLKKLIFKAFTSGYSSTSFFMQGKGDYAFKGGTKVDESFSLLAKGLTVDEFAKTAGRVVYWELKLTDVKIRPSS